MNSFTEKKGSKKNNQGLLTIKDEDSNADSDFSAEENNQKNGGKNEQNKDQTINAEKSEKIEPKSTNLKG